MRRIVSGLSGERHGVLRTSCSAEPLEFGAVDIGLRHCQRLEELRVPLRGIDKVLPLNELSSQTGFYRTEPFNLSSLQLRMGQVRP